MKYSKFLSLLAAGAVAAPAFAQTAEPSDAPTAKWGPRIALEENGVRPWVTFTGEGWTRADGLDTGNANIWNMLVDFGVEIDLGKFGGPATGMIVAQGRWSEATRDSVKLGTGSRNAASSIFAEDQFRVFNLYYTQNWNNEEFAVKIGQIAADDDFMVSKYSSLFLNGSFGKIPAVVSTSLSKTSGTAYASYPVAAPGVWFNWNINEKFSWQSAAYLGAPGNDERSNHGFDWKSICDGGVLFFTEGAWDFALAGKPSTLKFGATLHTGDMSNLSTGGNYDNVYSLYLVHDFALAVDAQNNTSLGAFWRYGISPQRHAAEVRQYADLGINWFAPIASRPNDVAGAAVSWTKINSDLNTEHKNEFTIELTYKAQLTSYWSVQGDIQYVIDPAYGDDNAWVLGVRTVFSF